MKLDVLLWCSLSAGCLIAASCGGGSGDSSSVEPQFQGSIKNSVASATLQTLSGADAFEGSEIVLASKGTLPSTGQNILQVGLVQTKGGTSQLTRAELPTLTSLQQGASASVVATKNRVAIHDDNIVWGEAISPTGGWLLEAVDGARILDVEIDDDSGDYHMIALLDSGDTEYLRVNRAGELLNVVLIDPGAELVLQPIKGGAVRPVLLNSNQSGGVGEQVLIIRATCLDLDAGLARSLDLELLGTLLPFGIQELDDGGVVVMASIRPSFSSPVAILVLDIVLDQKGQPAFRSRVSLASAGLDLSLASLTLLSEATGNSADVGIIATGTCFDIRADDQLGSFYFRYRPDEELDWARIVSGEEGTTQLNLGTAVSAGSQDSSFVVFAGLLLDQQADLFTSLLSVDAATGAPVSLRTFESVPTSRPFIAFEQVFLAAQGDSDGILVNLDLLTLEGNGQLMPDLSSNDEFSQPRHGLIAWQGAGVEGEVLTGVVETGLGPDSACFAGAPFGLVDGPALSVSELEVILADRGIASTFIDVLVLGDVTNYRFFQDAIEIVDNESFEPGCP